MADPRLSDQWERALGGDSGPLGQQLAAESRLPGPRANLELAHRFADLVGRTEADRRADALAVLARWLHATGGSGITTSDSRGEPPESHREYLAAVAALATGALLAGAPDAVAEDLLTSATSDDRWRVRELAATGLQRVLAAEWIRGATQARAWLRAGALPTRAAVAGVAEPSLLHDAEHAADTCAIVGDAADVLLAAPPSERRDPDLRVLRKALAYAVSVVAAADPDNGIALLERLASSGDPDARWVVRQNLTKSRLAPLADRLGAVREALDRS